MDTITASKVAFVAIGRNEGDRFKRCLASVQRVADRVVYVDSGSTDGSVAHARSKGADVVELDMSIPFTAARARNAGAEAVLAKWADTQAIQFIDGDCELEAGWLAEGVRALNENPALGLVTGWLRERHPEASVYNKMCELEWSGPPGPIEASGGNMLVRRKAFDETGGFNPGVVAAEDDEFCVRLSEKGWQLERIGVEMLIHDAAIFHFREWWTRAIRTGHAYAQVGDLHPEYFVVNRRRTLLWGLAIPVLALIGFWLWWPLGLLVLALYGVSFAKTFQGLRRRHVDLRDAAQTAGFLVIAKFPNLWGMLTYWQRKLKGRDLTLIEYK